MFYSLWWVSDRSKIIDCIKNKSIAEIQAAEKEVGARGLHFHPRMDNMIWKGSLSEMAKNRKNIPFLIGTTHDETSWDLMVAPNVFNKEKDHKFFVNKEKLNKPETVRKECETR